MAHKVVILGAGNAGYALAWDLGLKGVEVMLFEHPDYAKALDGIKERGGIESVASMTIGDTRVPSDFPGFARVNRLTTDPAEAAAFARLLVMAVPAFAQESIFRMFLPHLRDGQVVALMPGNFGSLALTKMMREAGVSRRITFVEASSIPYAVRVIGPARIYMLGKKDAVSAGVYPAREADAAFSIASEALLLKVIPLANVLAAGLANANMIIHVATATLGMGPMESLRGRIQFYREGCSDSVAKVLEAEDRERLAVGAAYGLKLMSFVETVNAFYNLDMKSIRDFVVRTPLHNRFPNDSPKTPNERYISEDCPYGLVPATLLGRIVGVQCATMDAIITIDSVYNGMDYFKEGRTPEKMGFAGRTKEQILASL